MTEEELMDLRIGHQVTQLDVITEDYVFASEVIGVNSQGIRFKQVMPDTGIETYTEYDILKSDYVLPHLYRLIDSWEIKSPLIALESNKVEEAKYGLKWS